MVKGTKVKKPLISIIIPTRNRQKYANAVTRLILSYNKDFQIIVHDNSDDDSLRLLLKDVLADPRLLYRHIEGKIAGVDNYNIAAGYAAGEYFCAIGDDDAVLPEIADCAEWMKNNRIDAVLPSKELRYFWPSKGEAVHSALLWFGRFTGKVKYADPRNGVTELLKNGGQEYQKLAMVGSYHGLVKTARMNEVKEKTGRFYGGLSPDMYSAVCLSLLDNMKFAQLDYPITLPGICPASTSAASGIGKHIGELQDAPHFAGLLEPYHWDNMVPEIYSVQTIWCETMIHAIKKSGEQGLIDRYFNREKLISHLYYSNLSQKDFILQKLDADDRQLISAEPVKNNKFSKIAAKFEHALDYLTGRRKRVYHCMDIAQAVSETRSYIRRGSAGREWDRLIHSGETD